MRLLFLPLFVCPVYRHCHPFPPRYQDHWVGQMARNFCSSSPHLLHRQIASFLLDQNILLGILWPGCLDMIW
jgi:hypothetical protein